MSKNTVELGRPQVKIWRVRTAWWISKAKVTHLEYVIIMDFSTAAMGTRTRINGRFIRTLPVLLQNA
jgi:hypothetical protein